jgi:hypothetical protein
MTFILLGKTCGIRIPPLPFVYMRLTRTSSARTEDTVTNENCKVHRGIPERGLMRSPTAAKFTALQSVAKGRVLNICHYLLYD